jgi:hypothetical protein
MLAFAPMILRRIHVGFAGSSLFDLSQEGAYDQSIRILGYQS